jgi:hypothetical protein
MRKIVATVFAVCAMGWAGVASAAPKATYNPATGNVVFSNDSGATLPAAYLLSASGNLADAANLLDIPGAVADPGDFPLGYTYLNLPVGTHNTGNTVKPGTPLADLSFAYYVGALTNPVTQGTVELSAVIPEPATLAMAGLGLIGLVAVRRSNG